MKFLSAQPDTFYFIWQIEIQLFNLTSKNWSIEDIHVLIGYNPKFGISTHSQNLIQAFPQYNIFLYPDTRTEKEYASTIRPHIIEKHFEEYPSLRKDAIFYIDSDVVFREIPDYTKLLKTGLWYASDTRSYMNHKLIIESLGQDAFEEMCNIVGISPNLVIQYENHTGGAQYIINNIPVWFWLKVEKDSVNVYKYLYGLLYGNRDHNFFEKKKFDIWLTEMWVVCWNAILAGKPFELHPHLSFCWANQSIKDWNKTYMLHYTGGNNDDIFRKTDYTFSEPFYANLSHISSNSSSAPLINIIKKYRLNLDKKKIDLSDTLFVIQTNISSRFHYNKLITCLNYLLKKLNSNILVLDISKSPYIGIQDLPESIYYKQIKDEEDIFINVSDIISRMEINITAFLDFDIIIPIKTILEIITQLRDQKHVALSIGETYTCWEMDVLTQFIFNKLLEDDFLSDNKGKMLRTIIDNTNKPLFITKSSQLYSNVLKGTNNNLEYIHQKTDSYTSNTSNFFFRM